LENFIYIDDRREFIHRVKPLDLLDYEERELPIMPIWCMGFFDPDQIDELFSLWRLFPEYHIVSSFEYDLQINGFVKNSHGYLLAEGDANPRLIHDPLRKADAFFFNLRNSGRNSL
jgi:hypothetical protein